MKIKLRISLLLASLTVASTLLAFDGKREGFMISAGAGLAATHSHFKKAYDGWEEGKEFEVGLATSFKIGYGFTDQFSLFLMRNSSFVFGYDNDPKEDTYGNCLTGVGLNYYLTPQSETYLIAAAGIGQFSKLSESDSKSDKGKAFLLGVGYEISPHVHVEGTYLATRVDDDVEINSDSLQLTLNYYWY